MKKLNIHSLDSVWTVCNKNVAVLLNHELSYTREFWVQTFRGKKKMKDRVYLIEARETDMHYFHTGLVPRVLAYIKKEGKKV